MSFARILAAFTALAFTAASAQTPGELRAGRALAAAVKKSPLDAHTFLAKMPKGSDLHVHLSGAVYAETFIQDAVEDGLCVDTTNKAFAKPTSDKKCGAGQVAAADVLKNQKLYDELVDAFSMRSFVPYAEWSGHDQFFATFAKFGGTDKKHVGEWVNEVTTRAAEQNEQYMEIMHTPDFGASAAAGYKLGWSGDLDKTRDALLETVHANVKRDIAEIDGIEERRKEVGHCGQANEAAGCKVTVRYIFQVLRAFPPQQVFAQTLLGFELAMADPRVVGINFVQPEDAYMAMSQYDTQMKFLAFLKTKYPKVHLSLHAGELAPGMVPPDGLKFHIREAVEVAGAERIGHGVDVMYEKQPDDLLKLMASRHVMTEINLTSNDVILNVTKEWHPLPQYRAAGVPVALSTDDEGVSRIDITHEYVRAAMDFSLGYLDLKKMARTSLEHSFVPGVSLWAAADVFTAVNPACKADALGAEKPSAKCTDFLKTSDRAAQQWELERRFKAFEAGVK